MSEPFDPNKLYFEIAIVDATGRVHGKLRREIHRDAAYIGNRIVDDIRAGVYFDPSAPTPMDAVVKVMRVRELRKSLLAEAARTCGILLAEHLEDREGWHGAERQERVEALYP